MHCPETATHIILTCLISMADFLQRLVQRHVRNLVWFWMDVLFVVLIMHSLISGFTYWLTSNTVHGVIFIGCNLSCQPQSVEGYHRPNEGSIEGIVSYTWVGCRYGNEVKHEYSVKTNGKPLWGCQKAHSQGRQSQKDKDIMADDVVGTVACWILYSDTGKDSGG